MHMHDHRLCSFMLHCSVHPLAYNMWGEWAHCALCELESQQPQQQPQQQLLIAFWLLSPMLAPPLAQKALHRHHMKTNKHVLVIFATVSHACLPIGPRKHSTDTT